MAVIGHNVTFAINLNLCDESKTALQGGAGLTMVSPPQAGKVANMFHSLLKKRIVTAIVGAGFVIQTTSCGTVLHPERRGQPCGRLDAGIVVLDAVGLLLFFIPGLIAFAVDFTNGTIYLPPERSADSRLPMTSRDLQTVRLSSAELTPQQIEAIVRERTGHTVHLEPGSYQATKLNRIEEFSPGTLDMGTRYTATQVKFNTNSIN